jgi:hypothetical protein
MGEVVEFVASCRAIALAKADATNYACGAGTWRGRLPVLTDCPTPGGREAFGVRAVDRRFRFGRQKGIRLFKAPSGSDFQAAPFKSGAKAAALQTLRVGGRFRRLRTLGVCHTTKYPLRGQTRSQRDRVYHDFPRVPIYGFCGIFPLA